MSRTSNTLIGLWVALACINGYSHGDEDHKGKKEPDSNHHDGLSVEELPNDSIAIINKNFQEVLPIFRKACFDCHSNHTKYPWYSDIPFVSHLIERDIKDAKEHLIMADTFPFAGHGSPLGDLKAIEKSIEEGAMPPLRYQIMHWDSFLSEEEIANVLKWASNAQKLLKK